ncbi:siderophore ABC transporter substrate-binding protein [Pseudomonas fragi]|uniref:siderophore ABC transporter substrate-binding protein n=1 Tax=Pseudomonas fragi TaxID=296 RepID=UPI001F168B03|nr:siderophore ABC transporter substrate-binding protein [Pseudomonas fragi]MCF6761883.1 siderophore ABC transporter substrate-binding protein [Pseudomonas fragi]MCK6252968.1 siderophore ABC transporter substrate-binding protein [Pseudomonas fragi]
MMTHHTYRLWPLALLLGAAVALQGCNDKPAQPPRAATVAQTPYAPVTVQHQLGTTVIERAPQRVVALDMNEVDFLDQLGIPLAGMPKDFIPHFLARYRDAPGVEDLGSIVQPNLERVHAARPDLILITSLQANHYQALSEMAATVHFDVDYRDSESRHIEVIRQHLLTLGQIFGKSVLAEQKARALDARVEEARAITRGRPERALVVLHNNGAFSSFGVQSRYGFIFTGLGVKPASPTAEAGLHGQPVSSEFIQQANPDIIYVVDRTAVMEHRPAVAIESMGNPLLRQTNAWKNGRVIVVDAQAWYVTGASPSALQQVIDDVIKGYQG